MPYELTPDIHTLYERHWIQDFTGTGDRDKNVSEWLKLASDLVPNYIVDRYREHDRIPSVSGGIYAFPAKHYHQFKSGQCDWITTAGKILQDDEAVFSLYSAVGNRIWSIERITGLKLILNMEWLTDEKRKPKDPFFLLHTASMPWETIFRNYIGVEIQDECLNPYKRHLWNLPDPTADIIHPPIKESTAYPRAIIIIPLFQSHGKGKRQDATLEHHVVKSAIWAAQSWYRNSDAKDLGVPIKFYIEKQHKKRILKLMKDYQITETDFILFDGKKGEGKVNHLGKKLIAFSDPQFYAYDWVYQMDSDMFLAKKYDN